MSCSALHDLTTMVPFLRHFVARISHAMAKPPKDARTFTEWWQPRYVREHFVVGMLIGFLLGALIWPLVVTLLPTKRPGNSAQATISDAALPARSP